mgnify:CR=1 FL=1
MRKRRRVFCTHLAHRPCITSIRKYARLARKGRHALRNQALAPSETLLRNLGRLSEGQYIYIYIYIYIEAPTVALIIETVLRHGFARRPVGGSEIGNFLLREDFQNLKVVCIAPRYPRCRGGSWFLGSNCVCGGNWVRCGRWSRGGIWAWGGSWTWSGTWVWAVALEMGESLIHINPLQFATLQGSLR